MNIAVSPKDVHAKFEWSAMYPPEELEVMRAILRDYTDVWRLQHPDATSTFTVWDEKTSARAFNEVGTLAFKPMCVMATSLCVPWCLGMPSTSGDRDAVRE